jgi:hypothetical protein
MADWGMLAMSAGLNPEVEATTPLATSTKGNDGDPPVVVAGAPYLVKREDWAGVRVAMRV